MAWKTENAPAVRLRLRNAEYVHKTQRQFESLRSSNGTLRTAGPVAISSKCFGATGESAAFALSQIPALMRIDAAITRHAGPLIVACGVVRGVALPVFMCAVVVTIFNRGKPTTRGSSRRTARLSPSYT